ncbi:MAG: hypothetical protein QNI89_02355 [Desulfobacterales bacterium]|nr:hypothetical protein [Desulfobacterales bacterium]MDJ0886109.1 hypothetical protein [Desulfobacterales bacterium]
MSNGVTEFLAAGWVLSEFAAYSLALLLLLRSWHHTVAEAAAGAALLPALLASVLLKAADMTGTPDIVPAMRLAALILTGMAIVRHRAQLHALRHALKSFLSQHLLAAALLLMTLSAQMTAVLLGWPDGLSLTRPSLGVSSADFAMSASPETGLSLSAASLFRILPGAAHLPWSAYLAICFATYALARRYAWPPIAITTTLLVASMPRLVFLSVGGGFEIIPAAAALVFILLLYRTVERADIRDFLLMLVVLAFCLTPGRLGLLFPAIGLVLAAAVLHRRHGVRIWWDLSRAAPLSVAAAGLAVSILCLGGHGLEAPSASEVASATWRYNDDGLQGAGVNLLRYGLLSLDLTPPVEAVLAKFCSLDWRAFRLWVHDGLLAVVFAVDETGGSFVLPPARDPALAWFGPFAGLLVLPALGWALRCGPRRLRSLALALLAYLALLALVPAWAPGNVRYFTVFFTCAGFTTAFLLPPWRMTRRRRVFLQACAGALMAYTVSEIWLAL